jgi:hypothetical protein
MTTTVTTATISTVTVLGFGATIALFVVLLLIGFLVAKEITTSVPDDRAAAVGRIMNVGAIPLLIAFAVILVTRLAIVFGPAS